MCAHAMILLLFLQLCLPELKGKRTSLGALPSSLFLQQLGVKKN
jgi:hypothetical protein